MGNTDVNEKIIDSSNDSRSLLDRINIKEEPTSPMLFSQYAKEAAEACSLAGEKINKTTQIRRFYDELVFWRDKIFAGNDSQKWEERFKEDLPYIQMLRAKVAYARGRELVDKTFFEIFDRVVQQIETKEQFKRAKLFMEAFLGYKKNLEKK